MHLVVLKMRKREPICHNFVLAHNGVLWNDAELQLRRQLDDLDALYKIELVIVVRFIEAVLLQSIETTFHRKRART